MTSYITPEERRFGYLRFHQERGRHLIFAAGDDEPVAELSAPQTPLRKIQTPTAPPRLTRTHAIGREPMTAEPPAGLFIRQPFPPSPTPSLAETLPVAPEADEPALPILATTRLLVAGTAKDVVELVRTGQITQPIWGSADYVSEWLAGEKHDPARALPSQIRTEIRRGNNTKRLIQKALGVPLREISEQVREMSKMGLIYRA